MSVPTEPQTPDENSQPPWYVYDRYSDLLHIAQTLPDAEAWCVQHWGVVEVRDREEVTENDYWYLLLKPKPDQSFQYQSRDVQARIVRQDRVIALGRDPHATPRHPE